MKRLLNKNYILLLILSLIVSFTIGYIVTPKLVYEEEANAPATDPNYDKMRISYLRIKERKTGLPSWDSVSDNDGHDASDEDNYLRTNDTMSYVLEVGIERNEATTSETDNFKGGKIKVKVTIPKDESGIPYLAIQRDAWMNSLVSNSDLTEITAYYAIPADKSAIGGNQQLSFTFISNALDHTIEQEYMPIFEVWMEGNQPDNSSSQVPKQVIQDEGPLYVTARTYANMSFHSGSVKLPGTLDGVNGEYINFGTRVYGSSSKGLETPVHKLSSSFRIEYSYKDIEHGTGWINIGSIEGIEDPLYGTVLYSYGRPCETTTGFYPYEKANTGYGYCASSSGKYISSSGTGGYYYQYDSGTLTVEKVGDRINFTNDNFYFIGNSDYTLASNGFELFVPWYEPEDGSGRYQYQVKLIDDSLTTEDSSGDEYTTNPNKTLTFTYYNYMTGNISNSFGASSTIFSDTTLMDLTSSYYFNSYVAVTDELFYGMDRLVAWNSSNMQISSSNPFWSLSYSPFPSPSIYKYYYGVLRSNPSNGLLTDEEVNAAVLDDFDWYESRSVAESKGKIAAMRFYEPEFRGFGQSSSAYTYLKAINDPSLIGTKGIVRQKIYLYTNEERTEYYGVGDDVDYTSSIVNDTWTGLSRQGAPQEIGQTYYIGTNMSLGMSTSIGKSSYNVEEEVVTLTATPSFKDAVDDLEFSDFRVEVNVPKYLSYKVNSSNYEPYQIIENSDGTSKIIWRFDHWSLHDALPTIRYQLEISPRTPNNSSKYIYSYVYCSDLPSSKYGYSSRSFYVINLSGSSVRKKIDKEYLDREEQTNINNYIFNIAQSRLSNVKTIEILPKNGDNVGTTYSGSYTLEVLSLLEDQKLYYTTENTDNIGLVADDFGKMHIPSEYNLDEHSDIWTEIHVGDVIPETATAVASYIPEITASTDVVFSFKFIPVGNTYNDRYFFKITASSDNLDNAIATEYKRIYVSDRKLSGIIFFDNNRNNIYDSGTDSLLANKTVKVYKANGELDRELTTNANGYYESYHFDKGEYYIEYTLGDKQQFVVKNAGSMVLSSIINPDTGKSDNIQELNQNAVAELMTADNKNVGIEHLSAKVLVHHYMDGSTEKVHDDVWVDTCYTCTYQTSAAHPSTLYEEYREYFSYNGTNAGDPVSAVVERDQYEVIYYYGRRPGTLTVYHKVINSGPYNGDLVSPEVSTILFGDPYTSSKLDDHPLYNYVGDSNESGYPTSGLITKENTYVYYYYERKKANVTVHHYLFGTTTPVHDDVILTPYYGDTYTTTYLNPTELDGEYQELYEYNDEHSGDPITGLVDRDSYEITYYYASRPATLKVRHYLINTDKRIAPDSISTVYFGNQYTTSRIDNPNYLPAGEYGETSGVVTQERIEVIYYYDLKPATITVHHYIEGTETPVHEDDVLNRNYGDSFTTNYYESSELDDDYKNIYEYVSSTGRTGGTINEDSLEVIYYYTKKNAQLTIHHYALGTTFKVHENEVIDKKMNDPYETHHKESNELFDPDYVYDSVEGNETGTMDTSSVVVTYYYKLKEGNIVVHHITDDSNEEMCPDETASGEYKTKYNYDSCTELADINYTFKEIVSNDPNSKVENDRISGRINQDSTEITYYYMYKPGQIVVHYFLEGTRERVADDTIADGKINEEYTSSAKELEGYRLVKEPEVKTITFKEDTQELIYEYERIKFKIEVIVVDGEGSITGAEEVFYGENEKNNVIITPGDNYEINTVTINGKEMTTLNIEGMTLSKFEGIKENILVEVKFVEKTQDIPITGKTRNILLYVGSILFILAFSIFVIYDHKKRDYNS